MEIKHFRSSTSLIVLGAIHNFYTSRVLQTTFAKKPFLYLLLKLTVHVEEPYRTRARQQLRSIFEFRQHLFPHPFPPMLKLIRCLQLCHGFVEQAAYWIRDFCLHHSEFFPPFHRPIRPVVGVSNPSLTTTTFNYKGWLQRALLSGKTASGHSGHTFARASDVTTMNLGSRNLADTTLPTEETFFAHMSFQISRWSQAEIWMTLFLTAGTSSSCSSGRHIPSNLIFPRNIRNDANYESRRLVLLPANHAASTLHVLCPVHFGRLLHSTLCDSVLCLSLCTAESCRA